MRRALPATCIAIMFVVTGLAEATDIRLTADPSVPAAAGKAELDHDRNGNLQLKVEVKHLAKPTNLTSPKQVYGGLDSGQRQGTLYAVPGAAKSVIPQVKFNPTLNLISRVPLNRSFIAIMLAIHLLAAIYQRHTKVIQLSL